MAQQMHAQVIQLDAEIRFRQRSDLCGPSRSSYFLAVTGHLHHGRQVVGRKRPHRYRGCYSYNLSELLRMQPFKKVVDSCKRIPTLVAVGLVVMQRLQTRFKPLLPQNEDTR